MSRNAAWVADADGVTLWVRATPRASKTALRGIMTLPDGPALSLAVRAPPVDGAANEAIVDYLAKALGVARRNIHIGSGETGRSKRLRITGDGAAVSAALDRLVADASAA